MSPLKITDRDAATGPVVEIAGDLDYDTSPQLRRLLDRVSVRKGGRLVLDLAGLEFCDSTGLTVLIAARNHALQAGAEIALAAVPPNTLRILNVVGLDQIFALYPSVDEATGRAGAPGTDADEGGESEDLKEASGAA
ncbi:STAS domain-containing protein [Streptomyces sp. NPDC091272]|uniref:STAS domain-containing protein n=1 Tax=Streptomyces sp. NPDC091272 TaxID=3365981 RepID=UPI00381414E1